FIFVLHGAVTVTSAHGVSHALKA
ncbi:hypothetical protein A2U01_0043149, partial [Trifolium medium]|nr:hypothetical protein [Trifolium medium]